MRRTRLQNRITLFVAISLVVVMLISKKHDAKGTWETIKETFRDDEFLDYEQMKPIDLTEKIGSADIDLSKIFVPADGKKLNVNFVPKYVKANATFYTIVRNNEIYDLFKTVQSVEARFNHKFHYDWVFISAKRINSVSKDILSNLVTGDSLFYKVPKDQWGFPQGLDRAKLARLRRNYRLNSIVTGVTDLMRFKHRFQAGFIQDSAPLSQYRYYMRIDPDVEFQCDIEEDFFQIMESQDKKFGFVRTGKENGKAVESLWNSVQGFFEENPLLQPKNNLRQFFLDDNEYNGCYLSNDLEIVDLNFLRSDGYRSLFEHLDSLYGWFYERWTDYHMHSILSFLMLDKSEVKFFNTCHSLGKYKSCAVTEKRYLNNKCTCDPNKDTTFDGDNQCISKLISLLSSDENVKDVKSFQKIQQALLEPPQEQSEEESEKIDSLYDKEERPEQNDENLDGLDETQHEGLDEHELEENLDETTQDEQGLDTVQEGSKNDVNELK